MSDPATAIRFRCIACGRLEFLRYPQCPACEGWDTLRREPNDSIVAPPKPMISASARPGISNLGAPDIAPRAQREPAIPIEAIQPIRITDVVDEDLERTSTEMPALDRVLGGGLVTASVVLLGGEPGAGKSTLLAQTIAGIGKRVLYITGEETIEQATMRARRVDATHPEIWIVPSTDLDETIAHVERLHPAVFVIDSIQTMSGAEFSGVAGSMAQVRGCTARLASFAKQSGITLLLIGHVTKDGEMAGPNTLKHLVDVVLLLECSEYGNRRTLRSVKNRFGSTQEVGIFEMTADGIIDVDPEVVQDEKDREVEIEAHEREADEITADNAEQGDQ